MSRKTYPANYNYGTGAAPYYHMKGIDALPRANAAPQPADKFDTSLFTQAQHDKYLGTAKKIGAAGRPTQSYAEAQKGLKAAQQKLAKELKQGIREKTRASGPQLYSPQQRATIDAAVKEGKTLEASTPSQCFSDVYYEDGVCTCVFARDGYVWEEEMSVDEFLALAEGPSMGKNWNDDWS